MTSLLSNIYNNFLNKCNEHKYPLFLTLYSKYNSIILFHILNYFKLTLYIYNYIHE